MCWWCASWACRGRPRWRSARSAPGTSWFVTRRSLPGCRRRWWRGWCAGSRPSCTGANAATGPTARAAVAVARWLGATQVVVAVPVGSPIAVDELRKVADEVVCPMQPDGFDAVSRWYDDFGQVSDAEVTALLDRHIDEAG